MTFTFTKGGRWGEMNWEMETDIYIYTYIYVYTIYINKIDN